MNKRNLSDRYTDLRIEKGLSQTELAAALSCNKQYISKFEDGSRSLSLSMLEKYADFFSVSTDYLLGRTDVKSNNSDIQSVCEYTGLSDKAVTNMRSLLTGQVSFDDLDEAITDSFKRIEKNELFGQEDLEYFSKAKGETLSACINALNTVLENNNVYDLLRHLDVYFNLDFDHKIKQTRINRRKGYLEICSNDEQDTIFSTLNLDTDVLQNTILSILKKHLNEMRATEPKYFIASIDEIQVPNK